MNPFVIIVAVGVAWLIINESGKNAQASADTTPAVTQPVSAAAPAQYVGPTTGAAYEAWQVAETAYAQTNPALPATSPGRLDTWQWDAIMKANALAAEDVVKSDNTPKEMQ